MVFFKKSTFFLYVFLSKKSQKEAFFNILDRKWSFWTYKVKFSQSRKKSTFCKAVSPWFLSKNQPFSHIFSLTNKSQKETFFDILDRKECFLDHKREVLKNSKKSTFCKGVSPWFLSKNRPFSYMFFLSKKSQKETFFDILDRK